MTKYDEYCYNLMESVLKKGAEGSGLTKEECVAYMNLMLGARGVENYINEQKTESEEGTEYGEEMGY